MFEQVVISPSTASAFVLQGRLWQMLKLGDAWKPSYPQQIANITQFTHDWRLLEDNKLTFKSVESMLQADTDRYDVLRFCLMGLDADCAEETRRYGLEYSAELYERPALKAHLEGLLYATAVPAIADFDGAIRIAKQAGLTAMAALLADVSQKREAICKIAATWDQFYDAQPEGEEVLDALRLALMGNGYYKAAVQTVHAQDYQKLDALVVLHGMLKKPIAGVNAPVVLTAFQEELKANLTIAAPKQAIVDFEEEDDEAADVQPASDSIEQQIRARLEIYLEKGQGRPLTRKFVSTEEAKAYVDAAIVKIQGAIQTADLVRARKLFLHLIEYQTSFSYKDNILKTCTNLLNTARKLGNIDFMETVLEAAEVLGTEDLIFLNSKAEVLKSQGRLEEALAAYDNVIERNPENIVARTGRAEVLKAQGRLEEALDAYDGVIVKNPTDVVARSGRAEVLKSQGRLEEALAAYDSVIEKNPTDIFARCGRAEVLKSQGRLEEALAAYDGVIQKNPENVVARTGRAEVLKSQGRLEEALDAYDSVIQNNPENVVARTGRAEVLKSQGRLKEALAAYDSIIQKTPENVVARSGRAEVLKSQGRLVEALAAYDGIIEKNPTNVVARNGRYSVMMLLGILDSHVLFDDLPSPPTSLSDWITFHIGCMALIQAGDHAAAISKLKFGLEKNQFLAERPFFISALATAHIFDRQFQAGIQLLDSLEHVPTSAIAIARNRILKAHALFEAHNREEAIHVLNQVTDSGIAIVGQAKFALEARYLGNQAPSDIARLDAELRACEFRLLAAP